MFFDTRRVHVVGVVMVSIFAAAAPVNAELLASTPTSTRAETLATSSIIVDGHIDVPHRVFDQWVDVTESTDGGDFDYPRAKLGGLNAPFMSIYVPAALDGTAESTARAHTLIDHVEAIVGRAPEKFAIARSPAEVEAHFKQGKVSLPLGMENGAPINGDLNNLEIFYQRGIRYITLTHSKSNAISDSSYDDNRQWDGLSPFGEELVVAMNQRGVMVDISHVSDTAFYDTLRISTAPVIASHSSLRKFTPGFERNMDDAMLLALAKNGGIIMINFGSTFVDADARKWSDIRKDEIEAMERKHGAASDVVQHFIDTYRDRNPFPYATSADVVAHIDYAVKLIGVDHVGLGSDYDGVGDSLPTGLKDVATYPVLIQGLIDKGYSDQDIRKILGLNLLRVWREVEKVAAES
ncbi:dipeptidase [Arenicella chitinivorans]|uniref:Dipeptidase n=1 Tax=Arenicella chitinivorans TaxID=1329800 RepID=A0A918RLV5_9GAMM|nr:dipeptidase [Arenicella chitinivorans]GHA01545.1 dipeptidase [Arenicella chitinivorans]